MFYLASNGGVMDDYAGMLDEQWNSIHDYIEELGWSEMDNATYERLLKSVAEKMREEGIDEASISVEMERNVQ